MGFLNWFFCIPKEEKAEVKENAHLRAHPSPPTEPGRVCLYLETAPASGKFHYRGCVPDDDSLNSYQAMMKKNGQRVIRSVTFRGQDLYKKPVPLEQ